MQPLPGKKIYFLSDFHLGAPDYEQSLHREKKIVQFLNTVCHDAGAIIIGGDVFDFWFEYKTVVPKYFVRLLGTLAAITDSGIPVLLFAGNHDMWMRGYFEKELNIPVYFQPQEFTWSNKKFFIGHGDGLGPGDHGYKFLKKIFRNPFCQWMFSILPPAWGMGLANYFSRSSRRKTGSADAVFLGEDKEWLIQFCKNYLQSNQVDYFIFGHRHLPLDIRLNESARYINMGDWIQHFTYAVFDGSGLSLQKWKG